MAEHGRKPGSLDERARLLESPNLNLGEPALHLIRTRQMASSAPPGSLMGFGFSPARFAPLPRTK